MNLQIPIITDDTGQAIAAAISQTDVAQARIAEINAAAQEIYDDLDENYPNYSQVLTELQQKTEKVQIDYQGGNVFKFHDQTLNFADIYRLHIQSPDFAFIQYGNRAYLCSFVNVPETGMKEMRFESVINSDLRTKVSSIYIISNDGIAISNTTVSDINSENSSNKVSEITEALKTSENHYPSTKAVADYVSPIYESIDEISNLLDAEIVHKNGKGYISINKDLGTVIDIANPTESSTGYEYSISPCNAGDLFSVSGVGGGNPRLYGFLTSDKKLLFKAANSVTKTELIVTAPKDSAYIVINDNSGARSYKINSTLYEFEKHESVVIGNNVRKVEFSDIGQFINTNESPLTYDKVVTTEEFRYAVDVCNEGDIYYISGNGRKNPRLWAFVDINGIVIEQSDEYYSCVNEKVIAPKGACKIVINTSGNALYCYKVLAKEHDTIVFSEDKVYINTAVKRGEIVSFTTVPSYSYRNAIVPCKNNDVFVLNGKGGGNPRLWAFLDSEQRLIENAYADEVADNFKIVAPYGSSYLVINNSVFDKPCYKEEKNGFVESVSVPAPTRPYKYDGNLTAIGTDETETILTIDNYMSFGWDRVAKMYDFYDKLVAMYPNYIRMEVLGKDASNTYELRCYTIEPYINSNYPKILFVSNIHGAEIPNQISTYFMAKELLEHKDSNDMPGFIFANSCIKIVPFGNPYGCSHNIGNNSNAVNLNRNWGADWQNISDGSAGQSAFDQKETQILRDFFLANTDAILAINQHNSSPITDLDELAYVVDNYVSDRKVLRGIFRQLDYTLKANYPWITDVGKYKSMSLLRVTTKSSATGTMDKWFNTIGIHGFLLEIAQDAGSGYSGNHSTDIIKIFIDIAVNLLGYMMGKSDLYLSDNMQTYEYTE